MIKKILLLFGILLAPTSVYASNDGLDGKDLIITCKTEQETKQAKSRDVCERYLRTPESIAALKQQQNIFDLRFANGTMENLLSVPQIDFVERLTIVDVDIASLDGIDHFKNLKHLDLRLSRVGDISALKSIHRLKSVDFRKTNIIDISVLAGHDDLSYVNLNDSKVKDISALRNKNKLNFLELRRTLVEDTTPLAGLEKLTYLYLTSTPVRNMSGFAALPRLEEADLRGANNIDYSTFYLLDSKQSTGNPRIAFGKAPLDDKKGKITLNLLEPQNSEESVYIGEGLYSYLKQKRGDRKVTFAGLPYWASRQNIEKCGRDEPNFHEGLMGYDGVIMEDISCVNISAQNAKGKTDLTPLTQFDSIDKIILPRLQFAHIEALSQLKDLRLLDLSKTDIADISPFAALPKLRGIFLSETNISDLTPLRQNQALRTAFQKALFYDDAPQVGYPAYASWIDISRTKVKSLEGLENLTALERIDLEELELQNLAPLQGATSLIELNLRKAKISYDFTPLSAISKLRILNLNHSDVTDISSLAHHPSLYKLSLIGTKVQDLSIISTLKQLDFLDVRGIENIDFSKFVAPPNLSRLYIGKIPNQKNEELSYYIHMPINIEGEYYEGSELVDFLVSKGAPGPIINGKPIALDSVTLTLRNLDLGDIHEISRLKKLEHLDLTQSHIKDLAFLPLLKRLKTLNLKQAIVDNPSPPTPYSHVSEIDITGAKINDYKNFFQSLPSLKTIKIGRAEDVDLSLLRQYNEIETLVMTENGKEVILQGKEAIKVYLNKTYPPTPSTKAD
ncbi:hypothetical protein [Bartonella sp. HY406]|uniref:hypothetical protein n=1 Tax=Bartonella sp. HY406 TaxID=2979331 RepID=UPI0021C72FC9|nr:hypothetical protein [Bartonella sp. HY406]UXN02331.1 hypothetical protein N6B01_07435 [Bartonella sp. HY406]